MTQQIAEKFHLRLKEYIQKRVKHVHDAEDILQDVYLKIHHNGQNLRQRSKLEAWLFQIVRNAIIDFYRRNKRHQEFKEGVEPGAESEIQNETANLAACLEPIINELSDKDRRTLQLIDLQGKRQTQLAHELGVPVSTVKSQVQRARKKLGSALLRCCEITTDDWGNILDYEARRKACDNCD